jgi:autotransporter adhesin
MNNKIKVTKDQNNDKTLYYKFDLSNDTLITDEVTITAEDILDYLNADRIVSMGKLSTLYE